ncbi:MAG: hypothetical protein LBK18_08585 [Prevotellaceae bacterium]|jgi:hypothetical protein|nr:hypothetical protein [Prevotellaceae bacterium]
MVHKLIPPALFLSLLWLASCHEQASIQVTNNLRNVVMSNVQFDRIGLGTRLLPGESTEKVTISDYSEGITFPVTARLQFYMVKDDNMVFLKTKNAYTLQADDELHIDISDDTEVVNSAAE